MIKLILQRRNASCTVLECRTGRDYSFICCVRSRHGRKLHSKISYLFSPSVVVPHLRNLQTDTFQNPFTQARRVCGSSSSLISHAFKMACAVFKLSHLSIGPRKFRFLFLILSITFLFYHFLHCLLSLSIEFPISLCRITFLLYTIFSSSVRLSHIHYYMRG